MITTKILTNQSQFNLYSHIYNNLVYYGVKVEYLQKADKVRGFYKDGLFCGGYVLNSQQPLRYLEVLPNSVVESLPDLESLIENCCIWFSKSMTRNDRALCYLYLLWDFLKSGKKYLIGGCLNPKIARIQNWALPHTVYQGHTIAGKTTFNYYGTKWDMIKCLGRIIKVWLLGKEY